MLIIDDYHSTKRSKNDGGPDDGEAPVIVSLVEAARIKELLAALGG